MVASSTYSINLIFFLSSPKKENCRSVTYYTHTHIYIHRRAVDYLHKRKINNRLFPSLMCTNWYTIC